MTKFKMGLAALAASAAMIVPAGLANAGTQSASTSNTASTPCVAGIGCIDLWVGDVLSNNDVDITTAANFCGVQVSVVNALGIGNWMDCGGGKKIHRKS
jgi:hypothetical protein